MCQKSFKKSKILKKADNKGREAVDFYIVIQVRSHFSRAHPMMKGISRVHACTCIFLSSNPTDRGAAPKQ